MADNDEKKIFDEDLDDETLRKRLDDIQEFLDGSLEGLAELIPLPNEPNLVKMVRVGITAAGLRVAAKVAEQYGVHGVLIFLAEETKAAHAGAQLRDILFSGKKEHDCANCAVKEQCERLNNDDGPTDENGCKLVH